MGQIEIEDKAPGDNETATDWNTFKDEHNDTDARVSDIEGGSTIFDKTQYNTGLANPAHSEGLVFYDKDKHALSYYNEEEDTTVNLAQEVVLRVMNNNGVIISDGQAVRVEGSTGGIPTIVKAIATTVANAKVTGVATHDIPVGETGYITLIGDVGSLDTSSFSEGDTLYLSETAAGELVNVKPRIVSVVGTCSVSNASTGKINVDKQGIEEPLSIGQAVGFNEAFGLTTTPTPLVAFGNTNTFENGVDVTQAGADPFSAQMTPSIAGTSGIYEINFNATIAASTNTIYTFEAYLNGSPTGILTIVDLSNANMDAGAASFSIISPAPITEADTVEIYGSVAAGTPTVTFEVVAFSIKRLGNL